MRIFASLIALTAAVLVAQPAFAQRSEGIAAVVNADIITTSNLKDRSEMILRSAGQQPTAALMNRVAPQALEGLIAEAVQMQEAEKQGITITDADVAGGIDQIAKNNNMSPEAFRTLLKNQGVKLSSIEQQVKAQLGWGRVIQQVLRPRVQISTSEIENERARMVSDSGKREALAAEIFLPVSSPADDAKIKALAQSLFNDLNKGRRFSEIARQHSASASAAQGGMIGWVREGQLEPALNDALFKIGPNQATRPIKGADGYYIMFVRDMRTSGIADPDDAVLTIRELVMNTEDMQADDAQAAAVRLSKDLTGCVDMTKRAASGKNLRSLERKVSIKELTASEKARLAPYDIGRATQPEMSGKSAIISMVCARSDPKGAMASDAAIERSIGTRRLDLLQKRYLRDLIAASFIERRI